MQVRRGARPIDFSQSGVVRGHDRKIFKKSNTVPRQIANNPVLAGKGYLRVCKKSVVSKTTLYDPHHFTRSLFRTSRLPTAQNLGLSSPICGFAFHTWIRAQNKSPARPIDRHSSQSHPIDQPIWANLNETGQMGLRYQLCLPDADEYFLIKSATREGRYQLLFVRVLSTEAHQSLWSVSPRQRAIQRNNSAHRLIE